MEPFCPNCGLNLDREQLFRRDGWTLAPEWVGDNDGTIQFNGQKAYLLYTIAARSPRPVRSETIAARMGHDQVNVIVWNIRTLLEKHGRADLIDTCGSEGYRWALGS